MNLDPDMCYRAIQTRDARFDGHFFTAVRTTGVYCRPLCPAPTPKRENVTFFAAAAAAQEAGYRPCLRCRPELSPDLVARQGADGLIARLLRLIADGALEEARLGALADHLGVTARHLRRLCVAHLGAAPGAIAQTRRLLFAKQLIDETTLPLSEVALAAGFGSIRRFNAVVQETYGRPPTALRRLGFPERPHAPTSGVTLRLPFSQPFDWDNLITMLAVHAVPGVIDVQPGWYRRTIALDGHAGLIDVRPLVGQSALTATIWFPHVAALGQIVQRLRRIFDLGAAPALIAEQLAQDSLLAPFVAAYPGLRIPGSWEPFELAVRLLLQQQYGHSEARAVIGRLAAALGAPLEMEGVAAAHGLTHLFPTAAAFAAADLVSLGVSEAAATALHRLAATVCADPACLQSEPNSIALTARLEGQFGIDGTSAALLALHGFGEPDAFPITSAMLCVLRHHGSVVSPEQLLARAETWRPWRGYASLYLWPDKAGAPHGAVAHDPA